MFTRTKSGLISAFNGHCFTRYRERMHLNLQEPIEIVKRFLNQNREWNYYIIPDPDGKKRFVGILKEGFVLGDILMENDELVWFVHKTFISRATANLKHATASNEFRELLSNNLIASSEADDSEIYQDLLKLYQDFGLMDSDQVIEDVKEKFDKLILETRKNQPETKELWIIN